MATSIDDNAADEQSDKSRCQLLNIRCTSPRLAPGLISGAVPVFINAVCPPPVVLMDIVFHQQILKPADCFQCIIDIAQRYPGTVIFRISRLCQKYGAILLVQPDIDIMPRRTGPEGIIIPAADQNNGRFGISDLLLKLFIGPWFSVQFAADAADSQRTAHFFPVYGPVFSAWRIIRRNSRMFKHIPGRHLIGGQGVVNICHTAQTASKTAEGIAFHFKFTPLSGPGNAVSAYCTSTLSLFLK